MKTVLIELRCPMCGAIFHKKSETLLLHGFESNDEARLRDGTFFTAHCPICGKESKILHNFLYIDKEHHFAILVKSRKDMVESDQELYARDAHLRKRYVSKVDEIPEKIRVLEDGLDDRVIEILKLKLLRQYQRKTPDVKNVIYHDSDRQSETLWFDILYTDREDIVGIEKISYDRILKQLPVDGMRFVEIDRDWALSQDR